MTTPQDGSTRISGPAGDATTADRSGTLPAGTDRVTGMDRVAGTDRTLTDRDVTGTDRDATRTDRDVTGRMTGTTTVRPTGDRVATGSAKTSAAAVFALVFGLAALFCALTGILSPAAVLFGIIGIALGIAGLKMSKRIGVTGHGVAVGGLVTAILGLLLGGAVLGGLAAVVNNQSALDRISRYVDNAKADLPNGGTVKKGVQDGVDSVTK